MKRGYPHLSQLGSCPFHPPLHVSSFPSFLTFLSPVPISSSLSPPPVYPSRSPSTCPVQKHLTTAWILPVSPQGTRRAAESNGCEHRGRKESQASLASHYLSKLKATDILFAGELAGNLSEAPPHTVTANEHTLPLSAHCTYHLPIGSARDIHGSCHFQ